MRHLSTFVCLLALVVASGCTSDEEKVTKVIERSLAECKRAEGDFAEVVLFEGREEVLRDACSEPLENVELIDEYHAKGQTGPYEWLVGIDDDTGVWVLTGVGWETLEQARRAVNTEDADADTLARAEELLAEAQKELPDSEWIRQTRLENMLELRGERRGKAENPTDLGEAQPVYDETLKWAGERETADSEAAARIAVIGYYRAYKNKLEQALGAIGGQDEWFESLIKQAKKDGNKEDEEEYRAELEKSRAERPEKIAAVKKKIHGAHSRLCEEISALQPAGIENDDLKQMAATYKTSIDCSAEALAPPETDGKEGQ